MKALSTLAAIVSMAIPHHHPPHAHPSPAAAVHRWEAHHRWVAKFKPFVYPDGSRWAAPYPVVWCESGPGGDYDIGPSGAYGLIPPFFPQWMSPKEQDEAAYHALHELGVYQVWRRWEIEQGCSF